MNISPGQKIEGEEGVMIHRWELHETPAFGEEAFAPPPRRFLPHIIVSPVSFEYEGEKGSFSNWDEYGTWFYEHLLAGRRSEEHTSELQSLMRISYAVFCLKKKHKEHYEYYIYDDNKRTT